MTKRSLFAERTEGFDALKQEREGKIRLREHAVHAKPAPQITAKELVASHCIPDTRSSIRSSCVLY
jgi:putative transcriptional regulator